MNEDQGDEPLASEPQLFNRPEGSRAARALGTTVHSLFQKAARMLADGTSLSEVQRAAPGWRKHAASILRNNGAIAEPGPGQRSSYSLADRAIEAMRLALDDPIGQWILGPRLTAQSETTWTGWMDGRLRTLRVDRIFQAGPGPLNNGDECLWIVDYKTATEGNREVCAFLKEERAKYETQLQTYGRMLRMASGTSVQLRLALYYPLMKRLEYWPA